jgi:hypothetical protein
MIKRIDGTIIDFSWMQCCKFKEKTELNYLTEAMRTAIKETVIEFKKNQKALSCNQCKTVEKSYEDFHVDHDNPSFQLLKNSFLKETLIETPTEFSNCPKYQLTTFKAENKKFKDAWVCFHNSNCKLQILCRDCNLKKRKE